MIVGRRFVCPSAHPMCGIQTRNRPGAVSLTRFVKLYIYVLFCDNAIANDPDWTGRRFSASQVELRLNVIWRELNSEKPSNFHISDPYTCPAEYLNPWNFTRFPPKTANLRLTGQLSAVDNTFVKTTLDFSMNNSKNRCKIHAFWPQLPIVWHQERPIWFDLKQNDS